MFVSVRQLRQAPARGNGVPAAPATITVFFMGEVATPGARELPVGTTFLQGLSMSGGLTNFAADRRIQLRRTDPHTLESRSARSITVRSRAARA